MIYNIYIYTYISILYIYYIYMYIIYIYIYNIHTYIYCLINKMLRIDMNKHLKYTSHNYHLEVNIRCNY